MSGKEETLVTMIGPIVDHIIYKKSSIIAFRRCGDSGIRQQSSDTTCYSRSTGKKHCPGPNGACKR